jgi:hypothetical protein
MDFNIRAISLIDGIGADARVAVEDLLGRHVELRRGEVIPIILPERGAGFDTLSEPERVLTVLDCWARVYRYPCGEDHSIHVLAPAENVDGEILFYRLDLLQPRPPRRGPRPAVVVVGGAIMNYDQCSEWLIDLKFDLDLTLERDDHLKVLPRMPRLKPKARVAWVGPDIVDNRSMRRRLEAIGKVLGADIQQIAPRSYRDVKARIAGLLPLHSVILCTDFAPYITPDVVPAAVVRELVFLSPGRGRGELEREIRKSTERAITHVEDVGRDQASSEANALLKVMLRGMLSHSKIGQFNHCTKATVLTGIRARHLNAAAAERILDQHSEKFQDTKTSGLLFLWKDHNDGRQYFLNPSLVPQAKVMVAET